MSAGSPSAAEVLRYYVEELRRRLGDKLVKVILFGSYARGVADEHSDIDALVVHRGDENEVRALVADATLETCLKCNAPLEPITMGVHEFRSESPFVKEVEKSGVVLYSVDPEEEVLGLAADYLPLIEEYLSYARECLEKGRYRLAVDLGYNAAELAVRALVLLKGETLARTHGGLAAQFARLYVGSGEVEREVGRALHEALMLRSRARYDPRAVVGREEAEKVVKLAERLLDILKKKIETTSTKTSTAHEPAGGSQ